MDNGRRERRWVLVPACVAVLAWSPRLAIADDKAEADELFKFGRQQMQNKNYGKACPALEKSFRLDPAIGTQLNIALCYEEAGLLARAFAAYEKAEKLALDKGDDRASGARRRASQLEPRIPRLTVQVVGKLPKNGAVLIDDEEIAEEGIGLPQLVDPGARVVALRVGGREVSRKTVTLNEGQREKVSLSPRKGGDDDGEKQRDPDEDPDQDPDQDPEDPDDQIVDVVDNPGRGRRIAGLVISGVGLVGVASGAGLALKARSDYNDAFDGNCDPDTKVCKDDESFQATNDARSLANTATVIAIVGGVAVGVGAYLYFSAPSGESSSETALRLTPSISPDGFGFVLSGGL